MRFLVTPRQMREADRATIEGLGVPSLVLMESAARGMWEVLRRHPRFRPDRPLQVLVGRGNNGGDGVAIARYAREAGLAVEVYLLDDPEKGSEDLQFQLLWYAEHGGGWRELTEFVPAPGAVVVDALFGTGFRGDLPDTVRRVRQRLERRRDLWVVAVDIPSGVHGGTGEAAEGAFQADLTLTPGAEKLGHWLFPGRAYRGKLIPIPIGIPRDVLEPYPHRRVEAQDVRRVLPPRAGDAHKGQVGRVLVLTGRPGYGGAVVLAAQGALRGGAGLVYVAVPGDLYTAVLPRIPSAVVMPMQGRSTLTVLDVREALSAARPDVVVTGPGLGRDAEAERMLATLLEHYDGPVVLDADALYHLGQHTHWLEHLRDRAILTPHPGEFSFLTGASVEEIQQKRADLPLHFAQTHGVVVLLKGAPTVVATPGGRVFWNPTGNPGMATGGTGDVLAGLIGALQAQGMKQEDAAWAGAYLHGLAGDILLEKQTVYALIAEDLPEALGDAFRRIQEADPSLP